MKPYNNNPFSLGEPYGNFHRKTKLERLWDSFSGTFAIERHLILQYSQQTSMSHYVPKFNLIPFALKKSTPDSQWTKEAFKSFVRSEFKNINKVSESIITNWPPKIKKEIEFTDEEFNEFISNSEWANRKVNLSKPKSTLPKDIAEAIYDILCNPILASVKNKGFNNKQEFVNNLIPAIKSKQRLLFVLPAFPFKDQNRFRVPYSADVPDFSEIAFMMRLLDIVEAIYQVYSQGSDIIILTDGELYGDIFGIKKDLVDKYLNRLVEYRYKMNIQGAISFISLKEMINRYEDSTTSALAIKDQIKDLLKSMVTCTDCLDSFNSLIWGMKWNMENKSCLKEYNDQECWQIVRLHRENVDKYLLHAWDEFNLKATNAALEYASVNLMLKWTGLIKDFFPNAIRATIHPKEKQFSFSSSGTYAWNGIAFSREFPVNIDDIKTVPLMEILNYDNLYLVKSSLSNLPYFYTTSKSKRNIELAKETFCDSTLNFDDLTFKKFTISDKSEFIKLGRGDENFSWERILQDDDYFQSLLSYRINHYEKYQFGVYGIWLNEDLIGQAGIQILDYEKDQLEVVIMLGNNYTHKGLGSKILNRIVLLCKENLLSELFAVTRSENQAAIKMLENNNWSTNGVKKHYNYEGLVFKLKLNIK